MRSVHFPSGFRLERLDRSHPKRAFTSGHPLVDDWLRSKAQQNQDKRLSVTKVLLDEASAIAGYYTLATGQVDFADLPAEVAKKLPRRMLPVAILAWLGVAFDRQGLGLGRSLLAHALRDCYDAGNMFAFIAIVLDCVDEASKTFYEHFNFAELPGRPFRLYLTANQLEIMMTGP